MAEAPPEVLIGGITFWLMVIGLPIFFTILFFLPEDAYGEEDTKVFAPTEIRSRSRTQVLVLGDIGRSPRMQYHALSIAKHGVAVDLIGYEESPIHPAIKAHKYITVHPIDKTPTRLQTTSRSLFVIVGPLKALYQFFSLWQILGHRTRPAKWLLVQNPPSIPVLAVAAVMCWLRKTKLVIDWHNFGHSILALKLGEGHALVRISRLYERFWAGSARANFVVSDAMRRQLKRDFAVTAPVVTVHDRPMGDFKHLDQEEREAFLTTRLDWLKPFAADLIDAGRTRLLVSSTSWTPDEDFGLLLDALVSYSSFASENSSKLKVPDLLVVITGKGPQKEMYLGRVAALEAAGKLAHVSVRTAWLSNADYAALLGAADLGVSLHTSSSGVDLPMKVVDMFGAGLPVVGWSRFEAWPELVHEGVNGRGFGSADELATLLRQLFVPSTAAATANNGNNNLAGPGGLATIKQGALAERARGWDVEWNEKAGPVFGLHDSNIVEPQ